MQYLDLSAARQGLGASASVSISIQIIWHAFATAMAQEMLTEFARTVRLAVHLWVAQHTILYACLQSRSNT